MKYTGRAVCQLLLTLLGVVSYVFLFVAVLLSMTASDYLILVVGFAIFAIGMLGMAASGIWAFLRLL